MAKLVSGKLIPKEFFVENVTKNIPLSYSKFIREESLSKWNKKVNLIPITIKAISFNEQGRDIAIPSGYGIRGFIHETGLSNPKFAVSILTSSAEKVSSDTNIEKVRQQVAPIHNRIPVIVKLS